ncbi:MAG: hypothetical protein WCG05_05075 [Alphaproteobacteria bacterium]
MKKIIFKACFILLLNAPLSFGATRPDPEEKSSRAPITQESLKTLFAEAAITPPVESQEIFTCLEKLHQRYNVVQSATTPFILKKLVSLKKEDLFPFLVTIIEQADLLIKGKSDGHLHYHSLIANFAELTDLQSIRKLSNATLALMGNCRAEDMCGALHKLAELDQSNDVNFDILIPEINKLIDSLAPPFPEAEKDKVNWNLDLDLQTFADVLKIRPTHFSNFVSFVKKNTLPLLRSSPEQTIRKAISTTNLVTSICFDSLENTEIREQIKTQNRLEQIITSYHFLMPSEFPIIEIRVLRKLVSIPGCLLPLISNLCGTLVLCGDLSYGPNWKNDFEVYSECLYLSLERFYNHRVALEALVRSAADFQVLASFPLRPILDRSSVTLLTLFPIEHFAAEGVFGTLNPELIQDFLVEEQENYADLEAAIEIHEYSKKVEKKSALSLIKNRLAKARLLNFDELQQEVLKWRPDAKEVLLQGFPKETPLADIRSFCLVGTFVLTQHPDFFDAWIGGFIAESQAAYTERKNPLSCKKGIQERALTALRGIEDSEINLLFKSAEQENLMKALNSRLQLRADDETLRQSNIKFISGKLIEMGYRQNTSAEDAGKLYGDFISQSAQSYGAAVDDELQKTMELSAETIEIELSSKDSSLKTALDQLLKAARSAPAAADDDDDDDGQISTKRSRADNPTLQDARRKRAEAAEERRRKERETTP